MTHHLEQWQHSHSFNTGKERLEKRTLIVVLLNFGMMIAEIIFGMLTNSMALLADGWHMGTHTFALGISLVAFILARKNSGNTRFTFGTWKIEILGAYTSALFLGVVALSMVFASAERLLNPLSIGYNDALIVSIIGLVFNLFCALILETPHEHDKDNDHKDNLNFQSAYIHVLTDALTSVFAIAALLGAKYFGWNWLDPLMGIVGAVLIARWAINLLKSSAYILLDHEKNSPLFARIKKLIETDKDAQVADLHLWKVADNKYACILSLVADKPQAVAEYKKRLAKISALAHVTIEVNKCPGKH